ncbi:hypothetical protein ACFL4P_00425 [Gemmatimonadota bacterium]
MNRKQFILLAVLMVAASFIGGVVASRLFNPREALAESPVKMIRANAFVLEDEDGNILASFNILAGKFPSLRLYDKDGRKRAVLGSRQLFDARTRMNLIRPPSSLVLFDEDGDVIWEAP